MKKLFALFVLTIFTSIAFAQDVPEKANTFIITLPDSNNVLDKITKVLISKDYKIKSTNKASGKVVTVPKTIKGDTRVSLMAIADGAEVILTGQIVVAAQGDMKVEYKGKKGTPIMNAWEEMEKVAKAFGGTVQTETR